MPFEDFIANFSYLSIVHVNMNAFYNEANLNRRENFKWEAKSYHDEWQPGVNAGGSSAHKFWKNPQYLITLRDVDLTDNDNSATVIVSLMQKESVERRARNRGEINDEPIQFRIYRVLNGNSSNNSGFMSSRSAVYTSKFNSSQNLKLVGDTGIFFHIFTSI
jgi:hypothetical protein